jgi:hypothetical protein
MYGRNLQKVLSKKFFFKLVFRWRLEGKWQEHIHWSEAWIRGSGSTQNVMDAILNLEGCQCELCRGSEPAAPLLAPPALPPPELLYLLQQDQEEAGLQLLLQRERLQPQQLPALCCGRPAALGRPSLPLYQRHYWVKAFY